MTTQLALKENVVERDNPVRQGNQVKYNNSNQKKIYNRLIMIAPLNLKGKSPPKKFLDYIERISKPKTYEEKVLDKAMKNLGEVIEEPKPTITKKAEETFNPVKPVKPIKAEKNLDSIVSDYHNSDVNPELNTFYNKNGATLAEPDNLMAHYTTAGANIFNDLGNNLGSKVKNFYNGIRNIKASTKKRAGLAFTTFALVTALATGCSGVVPEPPTPTPPGPNDDVADSHKVTAIAPYYEVEEEKSYCLISKGVIVTNYESNYGVENPKKVLTQQELADEIFLGFGVGATMEALVNYINGRTDLNIKAEIQYLPILEIQKMIEDDIVPIVSTKYGTSVYLPVAYNKITEEITNYATLSGEEITANQFELFNLDNNKSVIIINKKKLSTYLDNLL